MREVAAVAAGAAVAAFGGLVLGEYPFDGWTPLVAGVLFALVVTEIMLAVGRPRGAVLGAAGALFSGAGLGWAVWISSGQGVIPIPSGGWKAIAVGMVVALARGYLLERRSPPGARAARSAEFGKGPRPKAGEGARTRGGASAAEHSPADE